MAAWAVLVAKFGFCCGVLASACVFAILGLCLRPWIRAKAGARLGVDWRHNAACVPDWAIHLRRHYYRTAESQLTFLHGELLPGPHFVRLAAAPRPVLASLSP